MHSIKFNTNKLLIISAILVITSFMLNSCHPAKHVPEGEYLLTKVNFNTDNKELDSDDLMRTVRQKPNRKTLSVFRFHLLVYNMAKSGKERKWKNRIGEVVGEPPVIFDQFSVDHSQRIMQSYLESQGYYSSDISHDVKYKKRTAAVIYNINANQPHKISEIKYNVSDLEILNIVDQDLPNSLLKVGENFNTEVLQDERERLVRLFKTKGYYHFSINNIHYYVDTIREAHSANLTLAIRKSFAEDRINLEDKFERQKIKDIYLYTNYDPNRALEDWDKYMSALDTIFFEGLNLIYEKNLLIKPDVFLQSCFILPGEYYDIRNVESTQSHLTNLRQFRMINIRMMEPNNLDADEKEKLLDCHIYLSPLTKQSYALELEGMNTSGNIGAAGGITYSNRNLFRGAEIFSVKGSLSLQSMLSQAEEAGRFLNTFETAGELKLNFPKLMLPFFDGYEFSKNHNPKTQLSTAFSYQQRPDYTRGIGTASFGYVWKGGKNSYFSHFFNPLELNVVKIYEFNPLFQEAIDTLYIRYSYEDYFITVMSYDFLYNNQKLGRRTNFTYLWFNIETAGNLMNGIYGRYGNTAEGEAHELMGVEFAQFVKADVDLRYYHYIDDRRNLVYRLFLGAGMPYGNSSRGLPFIKKYFTGGANDLRAWQVRSLGPGSYPYQSGFDQIGDMKIVMNLEYRFKVISFLEGALFFDAGNIWAIDKNDDREGALFETDRFYKEIALGSGIGARFDFTFFVLRFDFGVPLYDPKFPEDDRWLRTFKDMKFRDLTFNFGIGYPF
jgi:outer membrane protein assembly factor BamA